MTLLLSRLCALVAITAGTALLPAAPASAAGQVAAPCAKLLSGESRYSPGQESRTIFVTSTDRKQNKVLITGCVRVGGEFKQEWQTTGFIGANGFAPPGQLREREFRSPTGSFSVTEALGKANPGTKLKYHLVNPYSRWGGPGSPSYNSYLEGGSPADENLWYWANEGTYAQAAVINYNRPPDSAAVPGADYAIFFGAGNKVSAGCVSTDLSTATRVVRTLVPGDRIIMGAVDDIFRKAPPPTVKPRETTPAAAPTLAPTPSELPTATPTADAQGATERGESIDLVSIGIIVSTFGLASIIAFVLLRRYEKKNRGEG